MIPYFSMILPIYNVEDYLERCILSILEQSFRDYEIILVNDGSEDTSPEICEIYASRYDNIHVVHKDNGGLSSARNLGLETASGKYIWWVDSDDFIEPGALELLYEISKKGLPDVVKFNYFRIEQNRKLIKSNARKGDNKTELIEKAFFAAGKYQLSACSHIYRRDFLIENGLCFVSERLVGSEDYLFNLEALYAASSVCVTETPLYNYELRRGSLTQQYKKDLAERYIRLHEELQKWFGEVGVQDQYEEKLNSFFLWHLIHSICIPNEYAVCTGRDMVESRSSVRNLLSKPEVQNALNHCQWGKFGWKQQIQLLAMKLRLEWLFYWLYVWKPKQKEKRKYEN